jgi:hypothetical protein
VRERAGKKKNAMRVEVKLWENKKVADCEMERKIGFLEFFAD